MTWAASLAPLREQNFRWYFWSRSVNIAGATMGAVALAFAVLEVSDSPSALGQVLAAHSIPMVVFLLAGGVIADRFGRTLVIQVSNVLAGLSQLAIAYLVISGTAQLWQLIILTAINGVVAAISFPALASVLPQLVPRSQLQPANVLMSMVRNSLTVIGPSAAALLVVGAGAGWAVAIDGVAYLVAAALLLRVKLPPPARQRAPAVDDRRAARGLDVLHPDHLALGRGGGVLPALRDPPGRLLHARAGPGQADRHRRGRLGTDPLGRGGRPAARPPLVLMRVTLQRPLFWGMLGTALYGLPLIALGLDGQLVVVLVAAVLAGAGIEVFGLGWNLAMQENIPDHMLSRAFSYDALGSFAAIPIGQLLAGPLALMFGIERVIWVAGVALVAIALLTLVSRSVRDLPRAATAEAPVPV